MNTLIKFFFLSILISGFSFAEQEIIVNDGSPILIRLGSENFQVLKDNLDANSINQVVASENIKFRNLTKGELKSANNYWLKTKLISQINKDRSINITFPNPYFYRDLKLYALDNLGNLTELGSNRFFSKNTISFQNPYENSRDQLQSQFAKIDLKANSTLELFIFFKTDSRFHSPNFNLFIEDSDFYQEHGRLSLYVQGILLGALFSLVIFGWYSVFKNRQATELTYGIWILFGFFSIFIFYVHGGSRFSEFFQSYNDEETLFFTFMSASEFLTYFFAYGQAIFYVIFSRTFLEHKKYFPKIYIFSNIYICSYFLHFLMSVFVEEPFIPSTIYFLPLALLTFTILVLTYWTAIKRLRAGMQAAKFFLIALTPYLIFRTMFFSGILGYENPLSLLPDEGLYYFIKDRNSSLSFAVVFEAIIMALAVVARTRYLQDELAINLKKQNELAENQNKILEATVAERTQELSKKHEELNKEHQIVTESINYAQIIQNGQLPRDHRVEGRFKSFYSFWEPRDKIGGDLWWVSTTRVKGEFALAVADCTGHGVPGAMLALLVSSSLEQIYSTDNKTSTLEAIKSLDYLTRVGLNQDNPDAQSNDGCDAAIIKIEPQKKKLYFTGAKLDLFKLSKNKTTKYSANRISLGYKEPLDEEPVETVIDFHEGDTFVIVTDGLTDQIGEKERKSYGYKRIENILNTNSKADAKEIGEKLKNDFLNWQGNEKRRDDVTFIAFTL